MPKTLQRRGNSLALVFDKTILDALSATAETPLLISFEGPTMTVTPVPVGVPAEELDEVIIRLRPTIRGCWKIWRNERRKEGRSYRLVP